MRNNDPFAELIRSLEEEMGRESPGAPPPPRTPRPPRTGQGNPRRYLWIILPVLILLFFSRIVTFYADWAWYDSLKLSSVFLTRIWASFGLFAVGALAAWLFLAANVYLARRLEPFGLVNTPLEEIAFGLGVHVMPLVLAAGALFALLMGINASTHWEDVLLYLNQRNFGLVDPIFHREVSFFMFTLPVWAQLRGWALIVVVVTLVASALVAGVGWRGWSARTPVLAHLAVLAALVLLLFAWGYRLSAYQLVYSQRGPFFGAGYTDVNAQLPAFNILAVVTVVAALSLVVTAFMRRAWRTIVAVLVVWAVLAVLAGNVYPAFVQRFQVAPNELNLERPYIANNIAFTRAAYDLDAIETRAYDGAQPLTADALRSAPETVRNIRLWDYRPLLQTYNQIQALTQYYAFNDVDVDRYYIDGEVRQVMLAARELVPERLTAAAQTWVNRKLVYTHGYGVAASPVAQVTRDGLPTFLLKDLPPQGEISLNQPQIYFGELTNDYVIARTSQPEFDYSSSDQLVTTTFAADTGIGLSLGMRLLFALHFADLNLLLNRDITSESQLLWRRNIVERVQEVAPFLQFDQDPYIVISDDGRLFWFQDAYVVSNRYPYSEPLEGTRLNYIRNPVKVVTSAYDGSMRFFVVDENEPIIAAYRQIFPDLFVPFAEMSENLKRHIRYPNDLFSVQAEVFRTYHMTNTDEFYNREDLWAWPQELFESQEVRMEPYYVLMDLPGEDELNFIQILPFTPANRENMISWLAAHNDPDKYGQKLVYAFGKDTLFFGPKQIESRISQDPTISAQLALWNQQGTNVIRGNLIVIPIGDTLLYVEPLYLQAASGRIPELQRVIVATANRVVMAENLGLALAQMVGREVLVEAGLSELVAAEGDLAAAAEGASAPGGGISIADATLESLIAQANEHYETALTRQRAGDWAGYGEAMKELQSALTQMVTLAGLQPSIAPSVTVTTTAPAGNP